jgi:hypothetical protein
MLDGGEKIPFKWLGEKKIPCLNESAGVLAAPAAP